MRFLVFWLNTFLIIPEICISTFTPFESRLPTDSIVLTSQNMFEVRLVSSFSLLYFKFTNYPGRTSVSRTGIPREAANLCAAPAKGVLVEWEWAWCGAAPQAAQPQRAVRALRTAAAPCCAWQGCAKPSSQLLYRNLSLSWGQQNNLPTLKH